MIFYVYYYVIYKKWQFYFSSNLDSLCFFLAPKLCWIKVERLCILVLYLCEYRRNVFKFFLLSMMPAVGLSYMVFIVLWYIPLMPILWRVFIIYVLHYYCFFLIFIYWNDHMDLSFSLLMWVSHWIICGYWEKKNLHLWDKSHLIMVYKPFNIYWNWFVHILWGVLYLYLSESLACDFLLFVG